MISPPPAPEAGGPRPNPEVFEGSLIYWAESPTEKQHFINGILEGYDALFLIAYDNAFVTGYEDGYAFGFLACGP